MYIASLSHRPPYKTGNKVGGDQRHMLSSFLSPLDQSYYSSRQCDWVGVVSIIDITNIIETVTVDLQQQLVRLAI